MSGASSEPLIACRMLRRHAHWNAGEAVSFPLGEARRLHAMRILQPLHVLVPVTGTSEPLGEATGGPARVPASVVRK